MKPKLNFKLSQIRNLNRRQILSGTLMTAILLGMIALVSSRASTTPNRYVDCNGRSDATGSSEKSPWSLAKANSTKLQKGQKLLLKRGCKFKGGLIISSSNITVSTYGSGEVEVEATSATTEAPQISQSGTARAAGCNGALMCVTGSGNTIDGGGATVLRGPGGRGGLNGVRIESGANNNTLRNFQITGAYAGVYIKEGANGNHIVANQINGNNMINNEGTAGAMGVLIWGNDNEVAYNNLNSNIAPSPLYCNDGAAVEIYNGSNNRIHHNRSSGSNVFTELGKDAAHSPPSGNVFAYNQYTAGHYDAVFLNTRGANDARYGPISNTRAYNNVAYLTGPTITNCKGKTQGPQGIVCHAGCNGGLLTARNNIMVATWKSVYADAGGFTHSNNIWRGPVQAPGIGGQSADPKFRNPGGGDFHLQPDSPARDAGHPESWDYGYRFDLDGRAVQRGAVDIGGYEVAFPEARRLALNSSGKGYVLDSWGKPWPVNGAPAGFYNSWPGWDIARSMAADVTNFGGGYVLDGWGGIHRMSMGSKLYPPASCHPNPCAYWPNWDIARDIAVYNFGGPQGYVLTGAGSVHPFGGAAGRGNPSWPNQDVARRLVLALGGYYILDMSGGVHHFGPPAIKYPNNVPSPYWPGSDLARALVVRNNDGVRSNQGYILDAWGGIHPLAFGTASKPPSVPVSSTPYYTWRGKDVARDLVITEWSKPSGYILDLNGCIHKFGNAPAITQPGLCH